MSGLLSACDVGGLRAWSGGHILPGLLSNQGLYFYFIMVPLRKNVLKYGTPKPSCYVFVE